MSARLENILVELARQHASYLLVNLPADETRLVLLADGLARNGVLVMLGEVDQQYQTTIQLWMNLYSNFYHLLASSLFSMHVAHRMGRMDQQFPPVIVLHGDSAPVIEIMGGYVVPFVDYRQRERGPNPLELRGVMMLILEALEATDLPANAQVWLRDQGVNLLTQMVRLPVRQHTLTSFAPPLFQQLQQQARAIRQQAPKPAPPPESLPEVPENGTTDSQAIFISRVPMFFKKGDSERMPPVRPPKRRNT